MPKDIHQRDTAQQRSSRLLLAMGIIVLLGALAYFVLTLVVNRRTPVSPDTHYTAENGISVYYESARSEERRVGKECRSRWSPYH